MTRSGKSSLAKFFVKSSLKSGVRILIVDVQQEWAGPLSDVNYNDLTASQQPIRVYDVNGLEQADEMGRQFIVVQPNMAIKQANRRNFKNVFEQVCDWVYGQRDLLFVVEEATSFTRKNWIPDAYADVVRQKVKHKVGVTSIGQRFQDIHNTIITQASSLFVYYQWYPDDVKGLSKMVGKQWAARTSDPDFFKKHKFLVVQHGTEVWEHDGIDITSLTK